MEKIQRVNVNERLHSDAFETYILHILAGCDVSGRIYHQLESHRWCPNPPKYSHGFSREWSGSDILALGCKGNRLIKCADDRVNISGKRLECVRRNINSDL